MQKHFFIFILSLIFFGCSAITYKDMELPSAIKSGYSVPEKISHTEWEHDKKILIRSLKYAYAGRFGIKEEIITNAIVQLKNIQAPIETKILCEKIDGVFKTIPDNHLKVF